MSSAPTDACDAFFYEAFAEEAERLLHYAAAAGLRVGHSPLTIQETGHAAPPAPVVSLRTLYALPDADSERGSIIVLQAGTRRYGVLVDALLGQHQTVIKPLGRMFKSLRGMSGSSILGNGEVALIFDVMSLCQMAAEPMASSYERTRSLSESTKEGTLS